MVCCRWKPVARDRLEGSRSERSTRAAARMQANRMRLSSLSTSNVVAAQQMDRFVNAGVQLLYSTFPTVNALAVCVVVDAETSRNLVEGLTRNVRCRFRLRGMTGVTHTSGPSATPCSSGLGARLRLRHLWQCLLVATLTNALVARATYILGTCSVCTRRCMLFDLSRMHICARSRARTRARVYYVYNYVHIAYILVYATYIRRLRAARRCVHPRHCGRSEAAAGSLPGVYCAPSATVQAWARVSWYCCQPAGRSCGLGSQRSAGSGMLSPTISTL